MIIILWEDFGRIWHKFQQIWKYYLTAIKFLGNILEKFCRNLEDNKEILRKSKILFKNCDTTRKIFKSSGNVQRNLKKIYCKFLRNYQKFRQTVEKFWTIILKVVKNFYKKVSAKFEIDFGQIIRNFRKTFKWMLGE